jgi:hypothetical protein
MLTDGRQPFLQQQQAAAPSTPPVSEPAPPRITITSSVPDCVQCKVFGLT